ncbi:MAG: hypothetical protein WCK17_18860 [Verrucomicrobiota bacterium]
MREKSPNILLTRVGQVEIAAYGASGCALGEKESRSGVSRARLLLRILFWCWVEGPVSADGTAMRASRHPPPKRALPRSVLPVLEATGAAPEFEEGVRTACWVRGYFMGPEDAYGMWTRQFILHHGKRHPETMGAV